MIVLRAVSAGIVECVKRTAVVVDVVDQVVLNDILVPNGSRSKGVNTIHKIISSGSLIVGIVNPVFADNRVSAAAGK